MYCIIMAGGVILTAFKELFLKVRCLINGSLHTSVSGMVPLAMVPLEVINLIIIGCKTTDT